MSRARPRAARSEMVVAIGIARPAQELQQVRGGSADEHDLGRLAVGVQPKASSAARRSSANCARRRRIAIDDPARQAGRPRPARPAALASRPGPISTSSLEPPPMSTTRRSLPDGPTGGQPDEREQGLFLVLEDGHRRPRPGRDLGDDPGRVGQPAERLGAHDDRPRGTETARPLHVAVPTVVDERRPARRAQRPGPVDGRAEPEECRFVVEDDEPVPLRAGDEEMDGRRAEVDRRAGRAGHGTTRRSGRPASSARAQLGPVRAAPGAASPPRCRGRLRRGLRGGRRSPAGRRRLPCRLRCGRPGSSPSAPRRAPPGCQPTHSLSLSSPSPAPSLPISRCSPPRAARKRNLRLCAVWSSARGSPVARGLADRAAWRPRIAWTSAASSAISSRTSASRDVRLSRLFLLDFSSRAARHVSSDRAAASANSSQSM